MVEPAGLDPAGTSVAGAGDWVDVRARSLSTGFVGDDQPHRGAVGAAFEVLIMLAWTIYFSFIGAGLLLLLPKGNAQLARTVALLSAIAGFGCAFAGATQVQPGTILTITKLPWIPSLGIEYHLAA